MAAKSIVDIDVNDEKFQEFLERFKEYRASLEELPEEWRGVGEGIAYATEKTGEAADESDRLSLAFEEGLRNIEALRESVNSLGEALNRNTASQDDFNKQAKEARKSLRDAKKESKGIASHLKDATASLIAWTSIVGVIGGMGTAWGLGALARDAQVMRFNALGINTSSGALDAANINYQGALNNPGSSLSNLSNVQNDASRRWILSAMGIQTQSRDPADILPEAIKKSRDIYNRFDGQAQAADAYGLTQVFSIDELNRFRNMSDQEIDAMAKRAAVDREALQISDAQLKSWAELNRTVDRSKVSIRNTFIDALSPLTPELNALSDAFNGAVKSFLESPFVAEVLGDVTDGLGRLSSYLRTDEFQQDVTDFAEGVRSMYRAIKSFVTWTTSLFGGGEEWKKDHPNTTLDTPKEDFRTLSGDKPFWMKDYQETPELGRDANGKLNISGGNSGDIFAVLGGGAEQHAQSARANRFNRESSRSVQGVPDKYDALIESSARKNNVDASWLKAIIDAESSWDEKAVSSAGAMGLGQVMPGNFNPGEDPFDPKDNIEAAARVLKYATTMSDKYNGGSLDETLRYYNGGSRRGSKENNEYPGRVKNAYAKIYGGAPGESVATSVASSGTRNDETGRETNRILGELLRTVQGRANANLQRGGSASSTLMDSKLLGG